MGKHLNMNLITVSGLSRLLPPLVSLTWCLLLGATTLSANNPRNWTYVDDAGVRHAFDMCEDNVTDGGRIGADARGCANPTFQPATLTNVTLPTGGTGELEYLWMTTTSDPGGAQPVSWDIIPGSSAMDYTPDPMTVTRYFMRCARRAGCDKWAGESNYVTITIDCCDPIADGGEIGGAQRACGLPYTPAAITNVRAADATGGLPIGYVWYASTTSDVYAVGSPEWTVVSTATGPFLDPPAVSETTYYVRVAQRERCDIPGAFTNVVTVEAFPTPELKADVEDVTCNGGADGAIALTVRQAAAPFTVSWGDGAAGVTRSGLSAGDYVATVTDANGCDYAETITVAEPAPVVIGARAIFDVCAFTTADIDVTVEGGTAPYTYAWDNGATTEDLTGVSPGTYVLTVTDAAGCTGKSTTEIAPPAKLTGTASVTQPTCGDANGAIALTMSGGVAPYAYSWSGSGTAGVTGDAATGLPGGIVTVEVTDANDCTQVFEVTLDEIAPLSIAFDADDIQCQGASDADLRSAVTGGTAPYVYRWNTGATTPTLTGVSAGTYTLNIEDAAGCTAVNTIELADASGLNLTVAVTQPNCDGETGAATASADGGAGGYTYRWRETGETTAAVVGLSPGTYTVDVTDANGCTTFTTATVTAPAPLSGSLNVTQPRCGEPDGVIEANVTGGVAPYSYRWTPAVATEDGGRRAVDLAGGDYAVSVTDANGCVMADLTASLDRIDPLALALDADRLACNGATTADIRTTVSGGSGTYRYNWDDGTQTADRTALGAGTYVLTVTDAADATCTIERTVTIAEPEALTASIAVTQAICFEDGGTLSANPAGGTAPYRYDWGTARQDNEQQTLNNAAAGDYTLTVTDANGCTATERATVEPTTPLVVRADSTDVNCPGDDTGTATVTFTGGESAHSIVWNTGATTATITDLTAGTYTATVTDNRGCVRTASTTVGTRSTGPVTTADIEQPRCNGVDDGRIELTTTGGIAPYTYVWDDDANAPRDRSGLAPGTYVVTVTDAVGCFREETYVIIAAEELVIRALPTTFFPDYFHVSAYGATDGALLAEATGGSAPYTFVWTSVEAGTTVTRNGQTVDNLPGGDYSLTVTDANGCLATHDTTLVEPSLISDYVWEDTNGDGLQDADEDGLAGVSVRISGQDFAGVPVDFSVVTDASGAYRFDRLPIGDYVVRFRPDPNIDFLSSPQDIGNDDALDSDMSPRSRFVARSVTANGTGDFDTDAGFIPPTSVIVLSDRVWYDADHDGIQDPFESPVQGVVVTLHRSDDNALVAESISNESGMYAFTEVTPGSYYMSYDVSRSSVAATFTATLKAVGTDPTIDSDFDAVTGRTDVIVVTPDSEDDDTYDLGLHEACVTVADGGAIIGNESVCEGVIPGPIGSTLPASGAAAYQWYNSTTVATYRGPQDPAWVPINGAIGETYQPAALDQTRHYIRLASDASCAQDYSGVSNVVTKTAIDNPNAVLTSVEGSRGATIVNGEITIGLTETLSASAAAANVQDFSWDFGADATPQFATTASVTGVDYAIKNGFRTVTLVVTSAAGCTDETSFDVTTLPFDEVGRLGSPSVKHSDDRGHAHRAAVVTWSAISLPADAYFEIQRADERGAFSTIAEVPARDYGAWTDYRYEDRDAPAGVLVYRVVHLAPSRDRSPDDAAITEALGTELVVLTYPNPASDRLTVEVRGDAGDGSTYRLTNVTGAVVRDGRVDQSATLTIGELPAGTYYLTVIGADGGRDVRPIVKR